jgi:hypothetical protein
MRQGADRAPLKERGDDLYETPRCAIRALMDVEALPHIIWEPAAGRGAIARELEAAGHIVIKTDLCAYPGADEGIASGVDFLMGTRAPAGAEMIVTNPPFKLADAFIRKGLGFDIPVIVLLRLMALEGASRSDLIDHHLARIWSGIERLPQMHREGWTGPKQTSGTAPFAWFVFAPERKVDQPIPFRRMSWRR